MELKYMMLIWKMEDLLTLPGVGRKVANLLRGDIYNLGGIVADTHCIRICGRLGFTENDSPLETETVMRTLIPLDEQSGFCHRIVLFGRKICSASFIRGMNLILQKEMESDFPL